MRGRHAVGSRLAGVGGGCSDGEPESDGHGQGRGRGAGGSFRLTEDDITFHKKTVLLVTCDDAHADTIVAALLPAARTGNKGDGLVTIKDVARAIRIRSGETADSVL